MSNDRCTCDYNSDLPGSQHAPSCPLFRFYSPKPVTHEERQHEAAYGPVLKKGNGAIQPEEYVLAEVNPPDIVGPGPVPVEPVLPSDAAERKAAPVVAGLLDYFPAALLEVAKVSKIGNDQHNPGQPLHWERGKSGDEADALLRHLFDRGTIDTDGVRHSAKVAWRALALLQKELEAEGLAPVSRGSWA